MSARRRRPPGRRCSRRSRPSSSSRSPGSRFAHRIWRTPRRCSRGCGGPWIRNSEARWSCRASPPCSARSFGTSARATGRSRTGMAAWHPCHRRRRWPAASLRCSSCPAVKNVPSSISSSSPPLPRCPWWAVLAGALFACTAFISLMEFALAQRRVSPTIVDSKALWVEERARASALGERALVLVGASRMQLDVDLDVLRRRTRLEPVQLAIDGTSFMPILAGLAADPSFRGSVIVDYTDQVVAGSDAVEIPATYQKAYEAGAPAWRLPDFRTAESWLTDQWR